MRAGWPLLLLAGCTSGPAITPHSIVSNNPCIDAVLAEVAAPGQVGAVSVYSHDLASGSAPLNWANALPALGTSAEEIIAAKPRLVLTGNLASSGTNAALTKAGVRVEGFGVPATVAESVAQVRQIAHVIGRDGAGEALVARIEAAVGSLPDSPLSPTLSPEGEREKPTAIIWQAGGFVAGKGTLQDELLARAGYRNASDTYGLKQWDMLPLETLIRKTPSVIFMPLSANGDEARALDARRRVLAHLGNRTRVVAFPDKLLFCGGPTIIEAMRVMRSARRT
jgi:iron complex transport system substrate-binding protein